MHVKIVFDRGNTKTHMHVERNIKLLFPYGTLASSIIWIERGKKMRKRKEKERNIRILRGSWEGL